MDTALTIEDIHCMPFELRVKGSDARLQMPIHILLSEETHRSAPESLAWRTPIQHVVVDPKGIVQPRAGDENITPRRSSQSCEKDVVKCVSTRSPSNAEVKFNYGALSKNLFL